jgi:hypothetical protein
MSVGFKGLIVGPDCEFLGAAGGRKKGHRSKESEEEEGLVAARKKRMSTCCLVRLRKDYNLRLARTSLRLRSGIFPRIS